MEDCGLCLLGWKNDVEKFIYLLHIIDNIVGPGVDFVGVDEEVPSSIPGGTDLGIYSLGVLSGTPKVIGTLGVPHNTRN